MSIEVLEKDGFSIVKCKDVSNVTAYIELKKKVRELFTQEKYNIIFDFTETDYMSSMGIAVIIECIIKSKEKNGNVSICSVHSRIERVMKTLGVYNQMSIFSSVDEAVNNLKKS